MSRTLFILLPALNEVEALSTLIPAIGQALQNKFTYKIVVIDDGSTDATQARTLEWQRAWPVDVVRHDVNQGYGAALRSGYLWALDHAGPDDIVVSLDSDNTHRPEYIVGLVQKIDEGFDVVTASYWMPGGRMSGVPFKRHVMSWVVNMMFRVMVPVKGVRCFTNGFRAYRVSLLHKVKAKYGDHMIELTGFPGGAELFTKTCRMGARAAEIPFQLHYENRGGASKIRLFATIRGYLRLLTRV